VRGAAVDLLFYIRFGCGSSVWWIFGQLRTYIHSPALGTAARKPAENGEGLLMPVIRG
jgi:hypothetical protein